MRIFVWGLLFLSFNLMANERLVLVGGGDIPVQAAEKFVSWAGGKDASILLIEWASGIPDESEKDLRETFEPYHPKTIEAAPYLEAMATQKVKFLEQLGRATGVFFAGGDQNRVMDLLDKEPELLSTIRAKARDAVFGGTSAGTAIMSETMITGEGDFTVIDATKVGTRPGLGLVKDMIVDQHFIKRMRANRLLSLILKSRERWGMGIDEGTSVALEDNHIAKVLGPNPVMLMDNRAHFGKVTLEILMPEQQIDLQKP